MPQSRVAKHAEAILTHAVDVNEDDMVAMFAAAPAQELVNALHAELGALGAEPVTVAGTVNTDVGIGGEHIAAFLDNHQGEHSTPRHLRALVEESDVVIAIKGDTNTNAFSHVSADVQQQRARAMGPILGMMKQKKESVMVTHPTDGWAQRAEMSLPEYRDFVYNAVLRDWEEQDERQEQMRERLEAASEVRIVGPDTDLTMSLDGMHAANDVGDINFPPGEAYTAPVVDSVEGKILFDQPALVRGTAIEGVKLEFEEGVVTDYSAEKNEETLASLLETDAGSDRIGEFGIGMNDGITRATNNVSFDEKMGGTVHLAVGDAYDHTVGENREANESAVHTDFIKDMSESRLEFDGEVVQENGRFVPEFDELGDPAE